MSDSPFFQWAGYLSNPFRRARIDVELHPRKEQEFRDSYLSLTGVMLRATTEEPSFVVLKESADKRGIQQRIYFYGDQDFMPERMDKITERKTGTKGYWRINSQRFVSELFRYGFLIGNNAERESVIRKKVPKKYMADFDIGFNCASVTEKAEMFFYQHYANIGTRTISIPAIHEQWDGTTADLDGVLRNLSRRGVIEEHVNKNMVTLKAPPEVVINNEIEHAAMRQAIHAETQVEKREYLIETYARNRGWKKLAQETFGTHCMYRQCSNTFIKRDGTPYIEVHHIIPLHVGGADGVWNLSVLCAHHHRMAHFARENEKEELKEFLLNRNRDILNTK